MLDKFRMRTSVALLTAILVFMAALPGAAAVWPDPGTVKSDIEDAIKGEPWQLLEVPSGSKESQMAWFSRMLDERPGAPLFLVAPRAGSDPGKPGVTVRTITLMAGTEHATEATVIEAAEPGPTVLIAAGVHGDQPAGVAAAREVAKYRDITRGKLIVLPVANARAAARGTRTAADGVDLNRTFPASRGQSPSDVRSRALWDLIAAENVDVVFDLHEASDYQAVSGTVGQTVIFQDRADTSPLGRILVAALNEDVNESHKAWRTGGPPVQRGLTRSAADVLNIPAYHVSTTLKDPMAVRTAHHLKAVTVGLAYLDMRAGEVPDPGTPRPEPDPEPDKPRPKVTRETLAPGTKYATTLYIIDSGRPGPTVWISGGTHGSELAGWQAADQIAGWGVSRGKLLVVPRNNVPAVNARTRSGPGDPDLNRQFPTTAGGRPKTVPARALYDALQRHRPDWVIDLHEAMSARRINPNSVGQTLIAYPRGDIIDVGNAIFREMNRGISNRNYHFQVIRNPVQGSLARAAGQFLGAKAAIFETTRLEPLNTRIRWQLQFVELLLENLDMGPSRSRTSMETGSVSASARSAAA